MNAAQTLMCWIYNSLYWFVTYIQHAWELCWKLGVGRNVLRYIAGPGYDVMMTADASGSPTSAVIIM